MATKFEELVTGMVNISFGAAATAVEATQGVLDSLSEKGEQVLSDFAERGEQVRQDKQTPDFARSMSDIFTQAGGTFSDVTERLSQKGSTAAERVLDELILARARTLSKSERVEFMAHVRDLIDAIDDNVVTVEVEDAEVVEAEPAKDEAGADAPAAGGDATA